MVARGSGDCPFTTLLRFRSLMVHALSSPSGHISIGWSVDNNAFAFSWIERGGPEICASNLQPALTPFAGTTLALLPLMCLQEPL
jgi:hypothetical protein